MENTKLHEYRQGAYSLPMTGLWTCNHCHMTGSPSTFTLANETSQVGMISTGLGCVIWKQTASYNQLHERLHTRSQHTDQHKTLILTLNVGRIIKDIVAVSVQPHDRERNVHKTRVSSILELLTSTGSTTITLQVLTSSMQQVTNKFLHSGLGQAS